jgi:hypothetical protein
MGMFDDYIDEIDCPWCGDVIEAFQGKDGPCELHKYRLGDMTDWVRDGVFDIHESHNEATIPHWIEALGVVYEWRWIATIITRITAMGDDKELWTIRTKE